MEYEQRHESIGVNLRSIDLNLLLIFDTVYAERSISKAARKLHLSQPAISNSLARLRSTLDDPLFTRSAHGMVPTPRAKILAGPIHEALDLLVRGLRGRQEFDFERSKRMFVIGLEDYGETTVLPGFSQWLSDAAPGITLRVRAEHGGRLTDELQKGEVDLTMDYFPQGGTNFHNECVLTDTLVSLSRVGHPKVGPRLDLEAYLALKHVALIPRRRTMPMIDLALAKRGLKREIALEVPHFLSMPLLVETTDMVCTVPSRMAQLFTSHFNLQMHTVPLRVPKFPIYLVWHEAANADAGHEWFRARLMEFCKRL